MSKTENPSDASNVVSIKQFKDVKFYKVVVADLEKVKELIGLTTRGLTMYQRYRQAAILKDQCLLALQVIENQLSHARNVIDGKVKDE